MYSAQTFEFSTVIRQLSGVRSWVERKLICCTVPLQRTKGDVIPNAERPLDNQRDAGNQAGEGALRGKGDSQAGDAGAGQQAGNRDTEVFRARPARLPPK